MTVVLALLLLTLVYALALGSFALADLLTGLCVSGLVLLATRRLVFPGGPRSEPPLAGRVLSFPRFAAALVWEITLGTWQVALVVTGLRPLSRPGIVAVPLGERSETGIAVSALALNLSPGEVLVDVDRERGVMLVHLIDASDPDAVRRRFERFYYRYQRGVFP
jgi:multicomponent Na+:H+ antiporter subunit E